MRKQVIVIMSIFAILALGFIFWQARQNKEPINLEKSRPKIVVNEALRTLLYIPLYHAQEKGYFREAGYDVDIVTGGTATNSFAALLSGEAQFSQADPMYVPISREKGGRTKVVAQVVARIAVWGLSRNGRTWNPQDVRGATISTQVRPMTAYVYAAKAVRDIGLDPEKDVTIIQSKPGTEIAPLLTGQADFAFTLEPNVSTSVAKGATIVLSYPVTLGDQVFTGLMTTEEFISKDRDAVIAIVRAYQRALDDIHRDPQAAIPTARIYFPQLEPSILEAALRRMVQESVIPRNVKIPAESWSKAIRVRINSGDLKAAVPLDQGCDLSIIADATRP